MSQEKPNNDPRRQTDWKNTKQTDEPWKGPIEKEQKPGEPPPRVIPAGGGTSRKDLPDDELVRWIHLWMFPDDTGRSHAVSFAENSSAARARVTIWYGEARAMTC